MTVARIVTYLRFFGGLLQVVESERRRQVAVGVDLPLKIGDLLLGELLKRTHDHFYRPHPLNAHAPTCSRSNFSGTITGLFIELPRRGVLGNPYPASWQVYSSGCLRMHRTTTHERYCAPANLPYYRLVGGSQSINLYLKIIAEARQT
jgi:hypothetical protein